MRFLSILFIFGMLITFASAEQWVPGITIDYDQFEDASVNTTLWQILDPPVTEVTGFLSLGSATPSDTQRAMFNSTAGLNMRTFARNTTVDLYLDFTGGSGNKPSQRVYMANNNSGSRVLIEQRDTLFSNEPATLEIDYANEQVRYVNASTRGAWKDISGLTDWRVEFENINDASMSGTWALRVFHVNYTVSGDTTSTKNMEGNVLLGQNFTYQFNATAPNQNNLVNATLFVDGVANQSVTWTGTTNTTNFMFNTTTSGVYNLTLQACDTDGECKGLSEEITFVSIAFGTTNFSSTVLSGTSNDFSVNITTSGEVVTAANLIYNNTVYPATLVQLATGQYNATATATAPTVASDTNIPWYWNLALQGGGEQNSSTMNQTVTNFQIDDCSTHTNVLYNFTMVDEITQVKINPATNSTTTEIDLEFYSQGTSTLIGNFSNKYTNENSFAVCLGSPFAADVDVDLQLQYDAVGYAQEFYHLQRATTGAGQMSQNITLYSLDDNNAQEFLITYKDANFLPVGDAIIQIQRKYISEGVFKTVEIPKTDSNGETLARLQLSDAVYNVIVLKNGEILASFNNVVAVCNNVATGDCELNLNAFSSFIPPTSYSTTNGFSFAFEFNKETRVVTSTFTITDGSNSNVKLNVTLFDGFGATEVCSDEVFASGGTLTCTIPQSFGNATFVAEISQDSTLRGRSIVSLGTDASDIYAGVQVMIGVILILTLVGIGTVESPMILGLFLIVSVIGLAALSIINSNAIVGAGASILFFVIAVILVMIKGRNT